ncbi:MULTISPECIES: class I SAM-dependent methyltransferase [unclassified Tolypothrix]|uniref:class I SAM-dependent methyltransferase n=1 Tax=unclassified Tolypothrix TaxID=2649714 RepID=UPI0005EABE9B|nr:MULTISPECIES: class I SAM-dependent methyltransferase [unclassified Tolypothrix]BAY90167.1 type 12 methyltransferase [Microchaete diplosiphon NIES-3275]EKF01409.1 methyltransferase domain protein [Tolypothrix sp. PCC 7601]MBE9083570.1 class I SAM-dependent methyltransferase [Tolypothrix sp. LEGE 11397]UYD24369.1 class I SAM-dependent methyltransferase [Tolypothrix sp. PCC 7712]UYD33396.1 class I SAM-dependent methyltransferase [Tolypothrix sp. PCC 7601]
MNNLPNQSDDYFKNNWISYQKVLTNNYMEHQEIAGVLHKLLTDYFQRPFSLLELGCGDASLTVQALLNTNLADYTGIDLSAAALAIAQCNMAQIQCRQTFIQDDISKILEELGQSQKQSFDVIMSSFVVHHLTLAQKDRLIEQISHLLKAQGIFILIDIVRKEEETQEQYCQRYSKNMRRNWTALSPQDISIIENHVYKYDFPETQTTLGKLTQKHNFIRVECLYKDTSDTAQFLCIYN